MKRGPLTWRLPIRISYGMFFLHTGLEKRGIDEKRAERLHGWAVSVYPPLKVFSARTFVRLMSVAELSIAVALLVPVLPSAIGGAGLAAYGAGLTGLYLRTPGMRSEGSLRPTEMGLGIAKDTWMLATGAALLLDSVVDWVTDAERAA